MDTAAQGAFHFTKLCTNLLTRKANLGGLYMQSWPKKPRQGPTSANGAGPTATTTISGVYRLDRLAAWCVGALAPGFRQARPCCVKATTWTVTVVYSQRVSEMSQKHMCAFTPWGKCAKAIFDGSGPQPRQAGEVRHRIDVDYTVL